MIDFSPFIDLPLVWAAILSLGIVAYVLLDGFDLGVGILFRFAPSDECRSKMMNSIAPFWDGNETWLVLGGGGLFAAFPKAFCIVMPAFYLPLIGMLLCLVFRGVAFEFRFKAPIQTEKKFWEKAFGFGSIGAAFFQGLVLGSFVQGIKIQDGRFVGGALDWINPFSIFVGISLVFGYALLGSNWVIYKTEGVTQSWARKISQKISYLVLIFMGGVSLVMPFLEPLVFQRWFSYPNILYLSPIPLLTGLLFFKHQVALKQDNDIAPFLYSISIFLLNFLGLGVSLWPWIVPYGGMSIWQAASAPVSQSLMLIGVALLLPFILMYTAYTYYVFGGKVSENEFYH